MATTKKTKTKRQRGARLPRGLPSRMCASQDAIRLPWRPTIARSTRCSTYTKDPERRTREKLALARQICVALKIHTLIEEELFYPKAREAHGRARTSRRSAPSEHMGSQEPDRRDRGHAVLASRSMTPRSRCWANRSATTSRRKRKSSSLRCARPASTWRRSGVL